MTAASTSALRPASHARRAWVLPLLAVALVLAGCKAAVLSKLGEAEANDALYTLLQGGVDAEKRNDGDAGFSLWAEKDELATAIGLLKANAQPEAKHQNLGELFGRNQLISTPTEERVRFVYGTEQALAQTLSKIDGVLMARVHIVLPENDPLATTLKPSSASVFLKHRSDEDLASAVPAIKELVVRSIEGLTVDRVAVTLFAASTRAPTVAGATGGAAIAPDGSATAPRQASFLGQSVPASSVNGLWLRFGLLAAVALIVIAVLGLRGLPFAPSSGSAPARPRAPAARPPAPSRPLAAAHE